MVAAGLKETGAIQFITQKIMGDSNTVQRTSQNNGASYGDERIYEQYPHCCFLYTGAGALE